MHVLLNRTFSIYLDSSEAAENDFDYRKWAFIRGNSGLSWSDLLQKRVVVILGEARIGKTVEFWHQAARLQQEGKEAFFLSLDQITNQGSVRAVLDDQVLRFEKWQRSREMGYFFLDAVDEARLNDPAALQGALRSIRDVLRPHLQYISCFISSRVTDWSVPGVRESVEQILLQPICEAEAFKADPVLANAPTLEITGNTSTSSIHLEVYCLDPLSESDAKRLAEAHGVTSAETFWREVKEGGYEFMACRPLDLEWMAKRWMVSKQLGTYADLIETAVTYRLRETNPSYIDSGAVLSPAQLREGAEQIAAACTFSGHPYVLVTADTSMDSAIAPSDALPNWTPRQHLRLLGTAIFDEKTYGRVKFHHRTVREYLAAYWVEQRLREGLPLAYALELFIQAPYGVRVLVQGHRPVLCWLASLNAQVREHVIRQFPEMLMFEGDPQCWSTDDVVEAFEGYVRKLASGYKPDWFNDASEQRRVARMLPPDVLAETISRYAQSPEVLYRLLELVNAGKVMSCADGVFALYRAPQTSDEARQVILVTLESITTPDQREAIAADLVSGALQSHALMAAALKMVGLHILTVEELTAIFCRTQPESNFGDTPMGRAIQNDLLPGADWSVLQKLLTAILRALPGEPVEELARRSLWLLSVLPDCLLHAVERMRGDGSDAPQVFVDAAITVERLRYSIHANDGDYRSLRMEIEKHQGFRRRVALAIALSLDSLQATKHLMWIPGLLCLSRADLDWLLHEAMRGDTDAAERDIWYKVVRNIAFSQLRGKRRQKVLATLTAGIDGRVRTDDITTVRAGRVADRRETRDWRREERARKAEQRRQREKNKAQLLNQIDVIRAGSQFDTMQWLVRYAAEPSNTSTYTKVNLEPIAHDFGHELAEAFSEGLTKVWQQIPVPSPVDYPENRVPWAGLIGLASVNHTFAKGLDKGGLLAEEVTRAVQFCIWELGRPEPWLDALEDLWIDTVAAALMPWFEHEIGLAANGSRMLRTIDVVLNMSYVLQRPFLQRVVQLMLEGKVVNAHLQKRLLRALIETGVASKELIAEMASRHLMAGANAGVSILAFDWFTAWAEVDFAAAWSWLETHATVIAQDAAILARFVAEGLAHVSWPKGLSGTEGESTALVALFRFLSRHVAAAQSDIDTDTDMSLPPPIRRVRDSIPRMLASMPGKAAHTALQELVVENAGTAEGDWLQGFVREHASAEAARRSQVSAAELPYIGEVYCREPRTEGDLYKQVMARLQEIQEGIEGGPFSDRVLFVPGMREKPLQLWLAARLSDTPLRRFIPRFRVHREPEVDEDKRTDIEVSSAAGKVCIEVKPVDSKRSYSAKSLVETLREQLVGQYLRGQNSHHGVLVVFRLDNKQWEIPGKPGHGNFQELVEYLAEQAAKIAVDNIDIEGLRVIGIDCVSVKTLKP